MWRKILGALSVGTLSLLVSSCSLKLSGPAALPEYPIEGLWIGEGFRADVDRGRMVYISSPGNADYPYRFVLFQFHRRNLLVNGKRMFFVRRTGYVDTSKTEALLIQERFTNGWRDNSDTESEEFWPVKDFQPEKVDRSAEETSTLDLLRFEDGGRILAGDDYRLHRLLPPAEVNGETVHVAETDVGVVLYVSPDGREAVFATFSPSMSVADAVREGFSGAGDRARLKVNALVDGFTQVSVLSGTVKPGDAVVPNNWQPSTVYERRLSREEVLRRLQRGEPVPREDLIRVLGEDAAP